MKVHLLQVPPEGLHIEGEEPNDLLDLHDAGIRPAGPVQYSLDVGTNSDGLWATGTIGIDFEFECVSCLRWFRQRIEVPGFATQVELDGREMVDLTDVIREDILLALPTHPRCDHQGAEVCPGNSRMGQTETEAESQPPAKVVWEALDQLKLKE